MSGHSKWNNIKRKKEKTDAAKAKVFTKIGREISVIVKTGGANPNENSKLKDAIAKAKAANVPNENIERIIKKAAGDGEANNYEELIYEGYGPSGVAVVVEAEHLCMTMRGARAAGATTFTSALRGSMRKDARTRAEVMSLLRGAK